MTSIIAKGISGVPSASLEAALPQGSSQMPESITPPALRTSIFEAKNREEWLGSSGAQLLEFERFAAVLIRDHLGKRDRDFCCSVTSDAFLKIGQYFDADKLGPGGLRGFAANVIRTTAISETRKPQLKAKLDTDVSRGNSEEDNYLSAAHDKKSAGTLDLVLQRELEQAVDRASDFYDTTLKSVAELMRLGFKRGEIAERLELSNMQTRLMMSKVTYKLSVGLALFNPERKEE
jgi:hypothetical protein